ncbi:FAD dependent oxidoreductase [Aspergillus avenaceus]|uniref:FAD dependent oxidoreductase n=1 Tax=Aspergillus avenaceus TaxID=36643 RepID=A0A5N6TKT7_ASPAV|nr:FAD dependent oxidoreductase [Aspergillus avenaceus]
MDKSSKIVIIGAGIFGLSTAYQLASEGYRNVFVLDRHMPPVPDGSSSDISRVIRFDYGDDDYLDLAYEAYLKWRDLPRYNGIFHPAEYVLVGRTSPYGRDWITKTAAALDKKKLPWTKLESATSTRKQFPVLTGDLANPGFFGYTNHQAGWADAAKAVIQLRDDCFELGVSFICGRGGTVVGFETDSRRAIKAAQTLAGTPVEGDHFVLSAGAWSSGLVPMYNSTLSTAQVLGYIRLTPAEIEKYRNLPIYTNFSSGWFNFPPHEDTQMLKMAIHGWGYTRTPTPEDRNPIQSNISSPPLIPPRERRNFVPADGETRLRQGLREILPELGERPFERLAMCWYTDTPSGDFIMDWHPDYANLFMGGGGSGHAFKFLPILGVYMSLALKRSLPPKLAEKWRFRKDYETQDSAFKGDGSRGGPIRRELEAQERAKL